MDLAHAVSVVVARPLLAFVIDREACATSIVQVVVRVPFVGVNRGALVPLLTAYTSTVTPLNLVHAGERFLPMRTRTLIDFLVSRMATRRGANSR